MNKKQTNRINIDFGVHFSLNLPQASRLLGMTILLCPQELQQEVLAPAIELSSRPERTRISCHAALDMAASAAFCKESRMKFASATKFDRKSGVAEWRDLRFLFPRTHTDSSVLGYFRPSPPALSRQCRGIRGCAGGVRCVFGSLISLSN
jgi:hypothetical protein